LRRAEYFGQYGKIVKIAVTRSGGADGKPAGHSAYVTFQHKDDARACIQALENFVLEGRAIK
jgi:CCR4-NOT transcription complex subunit 4